MPANNVAVGDMVQVVVKSETGSPINLNVLHYRCYSVPTDPTYTPAMNELITAIRSGINSVVGSMIECMHNTWAVTSVTAQRVRPAREYYVRQEFSTAGQAAGGALPSNVTLALHKNVEAVGRGKTGHFFQGGLSQTFLASSDAWDVAFLNTQVADLCSKLASGQVGLAGAYCWYPHTAPVGGGSGSRVRSLGANGAPHVMRRRTKGYGI